MTSSLPPRRVVVLFSLGLFVLTAGPGCDLFDTFEYAKFNKGAGVGSDVVLVVPFSEPKQTRWYGESERGDFVVRAFKDWVRTNATPYLAEGRDAEGILRRVRDWNADRIDIEDWQKLTQAYGIRYVVAGEIEDLSLTNPNNIGIVDASLTVSYRVVDVEKGAIAWDREHHRVKLSHGREIEAPTLQVGADMQLIESTLLRRLGEQIAKDLYGYYPDAG